MIDEELRALIEVLEPHQRANTLVQRMLVANHGRRPAPKSIDAAFCLKSRGKGGRVGDL